MLWMYNNNMSKHMYMVSAEFGNINILTKKYLRLDLLALWLNDDLKRCENNFYADSSRVWLSLRKCDWLHANSFNCIKTSRQRKPTDAYTASNIQSKITAFCGDKM